MLPLCGFNYHNSVELLVRKTGTLIAGIIEETRLGEAQFGAEMQEWFSCARLALKLKETMMTVGYVVTGRNVCAHFPY